MPLNIRMLSKQGSAPTQGVGSARPNLKKGALETENPLCTGFTALRGGLRPLSQTIVLEGARPWGRCRAEFANIH